MALRLSGQLLLGVVTIYSKKAEYLLGDCNNILTKVKTTFRAGNVDLSTANVRSTHAQAQNLLLADTITELDLTLPPLDFNLDFDMDAPLSTANVARQQDITMDSLEYPRGGGGLSILAEEEEDPLAGGVGDMDLDIGLDDGPSVELGRRAVSELRDDPNQSLLDFDTTLDKLPQPGDADISAAPDFVLEDIPEFQPDDLTLPMTPRASSLTRDPEQTPRPEDAADQTTPRPAKQAPRKRKIVEDAATEIPSRTVSLNLRDTSAIRKKQRFLNADPVMLSLQHKSTTGGFAVDVFGPPNLNPSIRNLLAPDFLRRMAAIRLKRKRDATLEPDAEDEVENAAKERRVGDESISEIQLDPLSELDLPEMNLMPIPEDDSLLPALETESVGAMPASDGPQYATLEPPMSDSIEAPQTQAETQTQVASIDTKEAVQHIRETLEESRRSTVSFEGLAAGTSRAAASELFFQVLLLATKDAIKVKQGKSYSQIDIKSRPSLATMTFDTQSQVAAA